ncbi:ferredoxin--NADP reductase [Buchnera aphidicola (Mollitrichosiphum nigrofasciatum)]|uniref:ferredoxin--NADP reductase n=1 Tax=Buchnera aphidicola TaxID=9 RepID=UPI0031B8655D
MSNWIEGKIIKVKKWSSNLFSIILKADIEPFIAGQFAKLSIIKKNKRIHRAYSYVNSPDNRNLEFYIVLIKNGIMTQTLNKININDKIFISKKSFGFFTINNIPKCENLWMISTGTGIGPYLSILSENKNINLFKKIILIHCVRYYKDLSYLNLINKLHSKNKNKITVKIILSREKKKNFLNGRITTLFKNDLIEKYTQSEINAKNTHIMLCGNPQMIKEMCIILKEKKKMSINLKNKTGNITLENYW